MHARIPIRLVVGLGLAVSSSLAATALPGGIAGATGKTVSCAGLRTNANVTALFLSKCTGTGEVWTGTAGTERVVSSGLEVWWKSGGTSLITATTTSLTNNCNKRTGYSKYSKILYAGTVTGGSASELDGGHTSGTVCFYKVKSSGAFAAFPVGPQIY